MQESTIEREPSTQDQNNNNGFRRDRIAAAAFILHLVLFLLATVFAVIKGHMSVESTAKEALIGLLLKLLAIQTGITIGMSLFLTVVGHFLIRRYPRGMYHFVNIGLVVLLTLWALIVGIYASPTQGVIYGIFTLIILLIYLNKVKHIKLTTALLSHANRFPRRYPTLLVVVLLTAIVSHLYATFANVAINGLLLVIDKEVEFAAVWVGVYFIVSIWWTAQVILNMLRSVVVGVVGTDYDRRFRKYSLRETENGNKEGNSGEETLPNQKSTSNSGDKPSQKVVWNMLGKAIRRIGSISYGSTLLMPISFVRGIINTAIKISKVNTGPILEVKPRLDRAGRNFNYLAFNHVMLRDETFVAAANSTWDLVDYSSMGMVMSDSAVGSFMVFAAFSVGLMSAFFSVAVKMFYYKYALVDCLAGFVGYFLISMVIPELYFKIVDSGTTALLVCVADDPGKLKHADPTLYEIIKSDYPKVISES